MLIFSQGIYCILDGHVALLHMSSKKPRMEQCAENMILRNSNIHRRNSSAMLIESSIPGSFEVALTFASDIGKKYFICDCMPGFETWQKCLQSDQFSGGCKISVSEEEMNIDGPCSLNFPKGYSQASSNGVMCGSSTPIIVYCQRKLGKNSVAPCAAQTSTNTRISDGYHSVISSEAHSEATKQHITTVDVIERKAIDALPDGEDPCFEEILRHDSHGALDTCCLDDSCSSSKSNLDLDSAHLKTDVEDLGECSSSGALAAERERLQDEMSERDICISILRSQSLLEKVSPLRARASAEDAGVISDNCLSCKLCEHQANTLTMIVCDNCEDAFHLSCCNPVLDEMPENEWFCDSCTKRKHKIMKEKSTSISPNTSHEIDRRDSTTENETGRLSLMLKDTEPFMPNVRIGSEFQAEVADWSGPILDEVGPIGESLEISAECSLHDSNCKRLPRISSIGNWLQCREVIEGIGGVDGTICGKWRRAPLFEVQTDDWECFRCVFWDPYHADCAVPQELDTDEVLKQLKYIEMLRPRLAAKRRKVDRAKPVVVSQCSTEI